MKPKSANKDEDVLKCIESWEEEYRDALERGVMELPDTYKITILKSIVTSRMKEIMELREFQTYNQARSEIMK